MRDFMDHDFMLSNDTAKWLYHYIAADMPVIDYHCHLSPKDIYEDRRFGDIAELWLGEDHYKWRLMRACGVDERFISGDAPGKEKFRKWAETLAVAIGNPLYHWSHLELKRYFGYEGILNGKTADKVWDLCNEKLRQPEYSARGLIMRSGVEALCTTDDPADDLRWHIRLREDTSFPVKVLPGFRPDRALAIEKEDFTDYIKKLGNIQTYYDLKAALTERLDHFVSLGCRLTDHGLSYVPFEPASEEELESIFQDRMKGIIPTETGARQFRTALLLETGRACSERDLAMQLHFGVRRNNSSRLQRIYGADAGGDSIGDRAPISELAAFLDALDSEDKLPRTIIYSLDPGDNAAIDSVIGSFQRDSFGKLQHGSAWWFNDHNRGMREQLSGLAAGGMLATFVGMLTDSRSFLSYARHEYFRRVLCDLIGEWVENGEFPNDGELLREIIKNICYHNARSYFRLEDGQHGK